MVTLLTCTGYRIHEPFLSVSLVSSFVEPHVWAGIDMICQFATVHCLANLAISSRYVKVRILILQFLSHTIPDTREIAQSIRNDPRMTS